MCLSGDALSNDNLTVTEVSPSRPTSLISPGDRVPLAQARMNFF